MGERRQSELGALVREDAGGTARIRVATEMPGAVVRIEGASVKPRVPFRPGAVPARAPESRGLRYFSVDVKLDDGRESQPRSERESKDQRQGPSLRLRLDACSDERPGAHGFPHTPNLQTWVIVHAVPQVPQFIRSIAVFTQRPPQFAKVSGQVIVPMHLPPVHFSPGKQTSPQVPQFAESVIVSTQSTPHSVSPPLHIAPMHLAPEQRWPAGHTVPQAPQFVSSVWRLEQMPPHRV